MDHVDPNLVRRKGIERVRDRAERTGYVRLEDDPQLLGLAGLNLAIQVLERGAPTRLAGTSRLGGLALLDHRPGFLLPGHDAQDVARLRHVGEPEDDGSGRRTCFRDALALVVLEGPNAAERRADDDDVAHSQRARLNQRGCHRPAALVELGFDDRPDRRALGIRLELLEVGNEQGHLEQVVEAGARSRADRHQRNVAAVFLDDDAGLRKLVLDAVDIRVRLVDLVQRDDDRHLGRTRMVDRLERLGHHAVIGSDHDDRDIGHLRAARAHRREGFVAGRVEEHDASVVLDDLAGTDVLGDSAALPGRDVRGPDRVEQARLAVVDVAHHRHDRCARLQVLRLVFLEEDLLDRLRDGRLDFPVAGCCACRDGWLRDLIAKLARDQRRRVAIDQLVDRGEDPALDELADDVGRVHIEQVGELLDRDGQRQLDRASFAGLRDLHGRGYRRAVPALRLARAPSAARSASTSRHVCLLGSACSISEPLLPRDGPGVQMLYELRRQLDAQRPSDRALLQRDFPAAAVGAQIGASPGNPTGWIDDDAPVGRPNDSYEFTLVTCRSARHAGADRMLARRTASSAA